MSPKELESIRMRDRRMTPEVIDLLGNSGISQCFRDRRMLLEFIAELEARLPTKPTRR